MCKIIAKCIASVAAATALVVLGGCATYAPEADVAALANPAPAPVTEAVIEHARAGDAKAEFLL
jgi:hypothetical protein